MNKKIPNQIKQHPDYKKYRAKQWNFLTIYILCTVFFVMVISPITLSDIRFFKEFVLTSFILLLIYGLYVCLKSPIVSVLPIKEITSKKLAWIHDYQGHIYHFDIGKEVKTAHCLHGLVNKKEATYENGEEVYLLCFPSESYVIMKKDEIH